MIGNKLSDRYEVVSELGRGGMGVVYTAHDPLLNRDVAIKIIAPSLLTAETEQRFQTEAQVVAKMDHPAIVPIFDFGRHEGSLFFVMPVVKGDNLRDLQKGNELKLGTIVEIGIEVAEALDYSHSRGVIHRDIKPENIMVALDETGGVRLRIMDFGLARGGNISSLTKTGMLMGTMSYVSPEQITGKSVDSRTDIYSLGAVLYESIVGEVPFTGEMQSLLYRVVHEVPQAPTALGCRLESEFENIILSCLAKAPADRPQSGQELARLLRSYRGRMHDSQRLQRVTVAPTLAAPRPVLSPFVGRETEFEELQRRLNGACRGECQFVVISGEPGVGKTRLLDELENLATARHIRVLHGRFVEQDGAFPYHGFCEVIQEFFRQREMGSASSGPPDLSDLANDLISLFPMLAEIPAIRSSASGVSQLGELAHSKGAENRTQVFELLARTITRLAGGKPLVLLFEDLHGADASLEALQYIIRRLGPTPTLVVATYRTTEIDRQYLINQFLEGFQGDRRFSSHLLEPFTREEHEEFLTTLTGGSSVAEDLAGRLFERTEGNPFFTKELVRSLIDSGSVAPDENGVWSLVAGADVSIEILPATIQQAVETRIGRLPDEMRKVLSVAAVMGKSFDFEDLEVIAETDALDLDETVDRFIQEGLLEEDRQSRGDRLAFSSAVVREVLYAELSRRKRRLLHRRFAQHLEQRQAGRLERVYPQLLYHYYEADIPEKTVEYGLLHARQSLESFSPEEVIRSAKTALEFLDEDWEGDPTLEGEARMLLASGYRIAGNMARALREAIGAVSVFEREKETAGMVGAILAAANAAWQVRQTEEARRWVERGIEAARQAEDTESLRHFLSLAATLANLRGEYERASEYLRAAETLEEDSKSGSPDEIPSGGRLVVAMANPIHAHFPAEMQLNEEFEIFSNVFETLLTTDEEGNLPPSLCTSWEALDGGSVFRFLIGSEVKFQDGSPMTAADVKASFEDAVRSASSDTASGFTSIVGFGELQEGKAEELAGLRVISERAFEIRLIEPLPIYPVLLTDVRTAIMKTTVEEVKKGTLPLGTGPFRIESQTKDEVLLARNPDYWRGKQARLESIEFRLGLGSAAIASGFRSGQLDLARDLLPQDLESILRERKYQDGLVETPQKFTYFILFNALSGPATRDSRVREALSGVIRVRDLVWQNLGRFAAPAVALIPPGMLGHDPGRRTRSLSVEEAKGLLESAGYSGTLELKAAVQPVIRDRYGALLEALLESWKELGVTVRFVTESVQDYLGAWQENEGLDLMFSRWHPDVHDPDSCSHALFHSENGLLKRYFQSEELDKVLDDARKELEPAVRDGLYRRFESLLAEGNIVVPLFHDIGYRIAGPQVKGLRLGTIEPFVNYIELGKTAARDSVQELRLASGGVVRIPMTGRVYDLDPALSAVAEEAEVHSAVYETLIRDVGDAWIEPWLAAWFRVEEGGKRYRFRLRNDVRFHDGRRLSVRDVRYTLERLLRSRESEARWLFKPIVGAEAILKGESRDLSGFKIHSTHEFTIELERPVSFFPVLLADPHVSIVPEGTEAIGLSQREGAVGTGPFRIVGFEAGSRLELERNPSYWRRGYPKCDRLLFDFGISHETILAEFRAGRFTLVGDLFPGDAESLRRDPTFAAGYSEIPRLSTCYVVFNVHQGPLKELETRKRLVAGIDINKIVRQTLGKLSVPAQGLIPPGLLGHDPVRLLSDSGTHSTSTAATLSAIELKAAIHPIFSGEYSAFLKELLKAFQRTGVKVIPVTNSMDEFIDALQNASVDLCVSRWVADYPDADTFAYLLNSPNGEEGQLCGTPDLDRLIESGRTETNPDVRHSIYRQIEETLTREALILPLFHEQVYRFARPELEGLSLSYWVPTVSYENLRIRNS